MVLHFEYLSHKRFCENDARDVDGNQKLFQKKNFSNELKKLIVTKKPATFKNESSKIIASIKKNLKWKNQQKNP
jgi:hypothetical protein